ncbi:MAG TPA: kelch repeat-containing protein [Candidatus Eremiobacteraceae bacterium]
MARDFFDSGVINGRLYAVGGDSKGYLNSVEAYDPETNNWIAKASMPTARDGLAAGVVNGTLYAVGGCCDVNGNAFTTNEAYNAR